MIEHVRFAVILVSVPWPSLLLIDMLSQTDFSTLKCIRSHLSPAVIAKRIWSWQKLTLVNNVFNTREHNRKTKSMRKTVHTLLPAPYAIDFTTTTPFVVSLTLCDSNDLKRSANVCLIDLKLQGSHSHTQSCDPV